MQQTITGNKRTLAALRLMQRRKDALKPEIPSATRETERPPLSFAQTRLWFLQQLDPLSPAYNTTQALRLQGELDLQALERAWNAVIARHEPLRTTFGSIDGQAFQIIAKNLYIPFSIIDFSLLDEQEKWQHAQTFAVEQEQQPFDLSLGPLVRVAVVRLADHDHLLLITSHHIVDDGWSLDIFINDLTAFYRANRSGEAALPPALPIRYRDFVEWQRQRCELPAHAGQRAYWQQKLKGLQPLHFPCDYPRQAAHRFQGARSRFSVPASVVPAVRELARSEQASLYTTLLAAFYVLLHRYTGQDDIAVGSPVANRITPEIERLIGLFVNTLVIRIDVSGNPSFRELLARTRKTVLEALDQQEIPFEKVVEAVRPERDLSHNPLFEINFALQVPPPLAANIDGLKVSYVQLANQMTRFDFEVHMWDMPDGIFGEVVYSTELFEQRTIERIQRHYCLLLQSIVEEPGCRINDLIMLDEPERHRLVVEWNRTERPIEPGTVCSLIENQAVNKPKAIAAYFEGQHLSYRELDERSNQLAHYLRHLGIAREMKVGVCLERSLDLLLVILATFKSGGTFVPLDPAYPQQRLQFMVDDSGATVVITTTDVQKRQSLAAGEVVNLDQQAAQIASQPNIPVECGPEPGDLAYVIYTSGSTGQPKGVLIEHRNLMNAIVGFREEFGFDEQDRMPCLASYGFDIFLFELLTPLVSGGAVELVRSSRVLEMGKLVEVVKQSTRVHGVPSLMRELLREMKKEGSGWERLRSVFTGGDVVGEELRAELLEVCGKSRVHVLYGPTEATIVCVSHELRRGQEGSEGSGEREGRGRNVIGRPLPNVRVRIVDGYGNVLPAGVAGEIWVGGAGVGRGYLNRREQTEEKFVEADGERVYRTGDRGRYLEDGRIEFLGRMDEQVKVRGFRVELGEVETALREHGVVEEAVVVVREGRNGEKRLVAYVVPKDPAEEELSDVQEKQVEYWRKLFGETYSLTRTSADSAFDTTGWDSSYTGSPIPQNEMREYFETTARRILELKPSRVLEVGCSTGLLLRQVAPYCSYYCATDISQEALDKIARFLALKPELAVRVRLLKKSADDLADLQDEQFDTGILNSVVQYFPDLNYARRVFEQLALLVPEGNIFIGDVRNFRLMKAFHASLVLFQAAPTTSRQELLERIQKQESRELLVAPEYFALLKASIPGLSEVTVRVKDGQGDNEISRFRYDVVLHNRLSRKDSPEMIKLDWRADGITTDQVRGVLRGNSRRIPLMISHVPNLRVSEAVAALEAIQDPHGPATAAAIRSQIFSHHGNDAIHPATLQELGDEMGYSVAIGWTPWDSTGSLTVLFSPDRNQHAPLPVELATADDAEARGQKYANNPTLNSMAGRYLPILREHLEKRIPAFMIPSSFVFIEAMPLSPNGKINREALPIVEDERITSGEYRAPQNAREHAMAQVWSDVLGVKSAGTRDNFFELGGDSILAIQVVAKANRAGFALVPKHLFQYQTIEELVNAAPVQSQHIAGEISLTPFQKWFFELEAPEPQLFIQGALLEARKKLVAPGVAFALRELLLKHEALRLQFIDSLPSVAAVLPDDSFVLRQIDLSLIERTSQDEVLNSLRDAACADLDLAHAPLLRAVLADCGPKRGQYLILIVHHLVIDPLSWGILLRDFEQVYHAWEKKTMCLLANSRFSSYTARLAAISSSKSLLAETSYWKAALEANHAALSLDWPDGSNTENSTAIHSVRLNEQETAQLTSLLPAQLQCRVEHLLLAGLQKTLSAWHPGDWLISLERDGRNALDDPELSHTAGCFTSLVPFILKAGDTLPEVKSRLEKMPNDGAGFGLLYYLAGKNQDFVSVPDAQISFNYLGQIDRILADSRLFTSNYKSFRPGFGPAAKRPFIFQIEARIAGGYLETGIIYSRNLHKAATIERLADDYLRQLRTLIQAHEAGEFGAAAKAPENEASCLLRENPAVTDAYPLTPLQEGLLFLDRLSPLERSYLVQMSASVRGALNLEKFRASWQKAISRHEILRTAFLWENVTRPMQLVHATAMPQWIEHDLTGLPEEEQANRIRECVVNDWEKGIDIRVAPALRITAFKLRPEQHKFLVTYHHILMDGWAVSSLVGEVLEIYAHDGDVQLPPVRRYREYVNWLEARDVAAAENFWSARLRDANPTLLPTDRLPRDVNRVRRPIELRLDLPQETTQKLTHFCRRHQLTLGTVAQGTWGLLLARYTGQNDVVFGLTCSGRPAEVEGVESMVGLFINTIPSRVHIEGERRVVEWLRELQEREADAREFQYSSLAEIQQWCGVKGGHALFNSIFVFENFQTTAALEKEFAGLRISEPSLVENTNFPISTLVYPGKQLRASIWYDPSLFQPETIERISRHYEHLLDVISSNPRQNLADLRLLSDAESRQLLVEWNQTITPMHGRTVIDLIESQERARPNAVAATFAGQVLSYGELNERANRLARHLRTLGVKPEVKVGLCLECSLDLAVAVLGTMKSGGAYLPLDPGYPLERLQFMLRDSGAEVLVSNEAILTAHRLVTDQVICLDRDCAAIAAHDGSNLPITIDPSNLAYMIYTSGSTGKPKGVLVEHRGLCNLAEAQTKIFDVQQNSRTLQFSSLSFDAFISEVAVTWVSGSTLCLSKREDMLPGDDLKELLEREKITHVTLPPSALAVLPPAELPDLATLIVAGEACGPELVKRWGKGRRFVNAYGPTENTVCATAAICVDDGTVSIGRPIANVQTYVFDENYEPVPIGVKGQLYTGGASVSRGYFNRPELTAEKFIPNPFGEAGSRLYATGDQVRWRTDGQLEFIGRQDQQIKIRGYRIERGEVENALLACPGVQEAVVAPDDADAKLVAYVVLSDNSGAESFRAEELQQRLALFLPKFMVPSVILAMPELPRSHSGKVDPARLPKPETLYAIPDGSEGPRTTTEKALVEIWCEVLQRSNVGIEEDFFEAGGHSLKAAQVISRIRTRLNAALPVKSLFQHTRIADLAKEIDKAIHAAAQPGIIRAATTDAHPLSFAQERLWFLDLLHPGSTAYNLVNAAVLEGNPDRSALLQSLKEIVRRHQVLCSTFEMRTGAPGQRASSNFSQMFTFVDCPDTAAEPLANALTASFLNDPFDLKTGPLTRFILVRVNADCHVLIWAVHHIVSDGWSVSIFLKELMALYKAFVSGLPSPLPEPAIQYSDYAAWQRSLPAEALENDLRYWRGQLSGLPPVLALPADYQRPKRQSYRGGQQEIRLSPKLTRRLRHFSQERKETLFMIFMAAFQCLLARYSSQDDFAIGTAVANRNRADIEGLIGFFVNTLALRADLSGDPTCAELLGRVKEAVLASFAHQELPFEKLVAELQPERDLSRSPLFSVYLTFENTPEQTFEVPGLSLRPLPLEIQRVKFDLELYFREEEGAISGAMVYARDLFAAATIKRMVQHYVHFLEQMVEHPEQRISRLQILTPSERRQLLQDWNQTARPVEQRTVASWVEEWAARTPEAVAVVFGEQELSYRELNERANQMGRYLRKLGVGPEVRVGVCLERSLDVAVAVPGVLKAGGAYVPLDVSYPRQRLEYMLQDSGAQVLLTRAGVVEGLEWAGGRVVDVGQEEQEISKESGENLPVEVEAEHLAYVIYTSGSTGRPKGVEISQGNLSHYVGYCRRAYHGDGERGLDALVHSSISFDLTVTGMFSPWTVGKRVVWIGEGRGVEGLRDGIEEAEGGVLVKVTPSHLQALQGQLSGAGAERVKILVVGGEALAEATVRGWREQANETHIVNEYGPTEATVGCCVYWDEGRKAKEGQKEEGQERSSVPIGRAIENTELYVLDKEMEAVPVGVAGELYIGGAGLGRGYRGQGGLTAERFVPHPYSGRGGERLYRTGDLAKWQEDGNLIFLGRRDNQVKIRGYRLELDEVESALRSCTGVKDAAVVLRNDSPNDVRLTAYIVPDEKNTGIAAIRESLSNLLPAYAIPNAFIQVAAIPLTQSDKADRQALLRMLSSEPLLSSPFVAPENDLESVIAEIWQNMLNVERVGRHDNFFELGGHSLLLVKVYEELKHRTKQNFSVADMFEHPTVAKLASFLGHNGAVTADFSQIQVRAQRQAQWFKRKRRDAVAAN